MGKTDLFRKTLLDALEVMNKEFDDLLSNVTEKEAQTLNAILDKIRSKSDK